MLEDGLRVLYFDIHGRRSPGVGGTSDTIWAMAEHAESIGCQATVAGFYSSTEYPAESVDVLPIKVPGFMLRNIIFKSIATLISAIRIINSSKWGLIHFRDYHSAALFTSIPMCPPLVVTPAGNPLERRRRSLSQFDSLTEFFYWKSAHRAARRCATVICTSSEQADWWERLGVDQGRMSMIPLGVDTNRFQPSPQLKSEYGLSNDALIVLYAGRMHMEIKGLDLLLEAFAKVANRLEGVHLFLVGDGPDREKLRDQADELRVMDRIRFFDWISQEELISLYSTSDLCVLPSRSEPFGRVVLEAMACGTPVMASSHGAARDHLQGGTGYLIDPIDACGFANAMLDVLIDKEGRNQVATKAREYVVRQLTWRQVMEAVVNEVYGPLFANKP